MKHWSSSMPLSSAAGDPDSFCRVDLNLTDAQLKKKFPQFPVSRCLEALVCGVAQLPVLLVAASDLVVSTQ